MSLIAAVDRSNGSQGIMRTEIVAAEFLFVILIVRFLVFVREGFGNSTAIITLVVAVLIQLQVRWLMSLVSIMFVAAHLNLAGVLRRIYCV